jgi:hypothetical protein
LSVDEIVEILFMTAFELEDDNKAINPVKFIEKIEQGIL